MVCLPKCLPIVSVPTIRSPNRLSSAQHAAYAPSQVGTFHYLVETCVRHGGCTSSTLVCTQLHCLYTAPRLYYASSRCSTLVVIAARSSPVHHSSPVNCAAAAADPLLPRSLQPYHIGSMDPDHHHSHHRHGPLTRTHPFTHLPPSLNPFMAIVPQLPEASKSSLPLRSHPAAIFSLTFCCERVASLLLTLQRERCSPYPPPYQPRNTKSTSPFAPPLPCLTLPPLFPSTKRHAALTPLPRPSRPYYSPLTRKPARGAPLAPRPLPPLRPSPCRFSLPLGSRQVRSCGRQIVTASSSLPTGFI